MGGSPLPAMAKRTAKKAVGEKTGFRKWVGAKMARECLIVLMWQMIASDDGDEDADGDGGRPEKGYGGIDRC